MLFYRQKILLALIEVFGGYLQRTDLQKYLFLFTEENQKNKSYEFVPYKYGCFSFQSYADRRKLIETGHLLDNNDWELKNHSYLNALSNAESAQIINFHNKYKNISGNNLIKTVYNKYPYFAISSSIVNKVLSPEERQKVKDAHPQNDTICFFTIGYEGNSFENYLNRLIKNNVKLLCDVRRNPLSRKYGFSKKTLSHTLGKLNIDYMHLPELGIISDKRQALESKADFQRLFAEYEQTTLKENPQALEKLLRLLEEKKRIAITCFESCQTMCHRGRVATALTNLPNWNYPVQHL